MTRYAQQKERIFVVGGRTDTGSLVLQDAHDGTPFVANPATVRRPRKEYIELPPGRYEDLRVRVGLVRSRAKGKYPAVAISSPAAAAALMKPMSSEAQEVLSTILVDTRNVVIGICEIHRGGVASAVVELQSVFKPALLANATGLIVVHNHPSGNPDPGPEDRALCARLVDGAALLGLRLLDFLVIGEDSRYVSFADRALL